MVHPTSDDIERYRALLAHDPESRAFGAVAEVYLRQAHYAEAIAVCDDGLQRFPGYVGARLTLARALEASGDVSRAEAEFRRVLERLPDSIPAHRALADLLRREGRLTEALVTYEALLALDPLDQEVRQLLEDVRPVAMVPVEPPAGHLPPAVLPEPDIPPVPEEATVPTFDLTEEAAAEVSLPLTPVQAEPPMEVVSEEIERPESRPTAPGLAEPETAIPIYDLTDVAQEEKEEEGGPVQAILATETLADLYARQGFPDQAHAIYEELLRADATRDDLREKMAALPSPVPVAAGRLGAEPEPAGIDTPGATAADGDVLQTLEAWLAAARSLRRERGRP